MNNVLQYITDNQKNLVAYLNKLCHNTDTAEDLYQDVCEAVLRYVKEDIPEEDVPQYVYLVCKRTFVRNKNKEDRHNMGDEHIALTFHQLHESRLSECADPLEHILDEKNKEIIPEAIEGIVTDKLHASFLTMVFGEDVSIGTAADLCGLRRDHARVIMHRFMNRIK